MKTVVVGISFVKAARGAQRGPEDNLDPSELQSCPPKCVCCSVIILIEDNYESLTVCSLLTVVFPFCLKLRPLLTTHWILVHMFSLFSDAFFFSDCRLLSFDTRISPSCLFFPYKSDYLMVGCGVA